MRYLLAALIGMALTLCVFVGGAAFAIRYLSADPVPVQNPAVASATAMPTDAVRVVEETDHRNTGLVENQPAPNTLSQDEAFEPAMDIEATEPALEFDPTQPMPEVDEFTTASIPDPQSIEPATISEPESALSNEHESWCSERYRSYRPEDNSYTPYSGGSRECVSPFSEELAGAPDEDASYVEASAGGGDQEGVSTGYLNPEHIESCFSRYRSYRPEDNTYQPYGGGPRKQCQ